DPILWNWFSNRFSDISGMHVYFRSVFLAEIIPFCIPEREEDLDVLLDEYIASDSDAPLGVLAMAREKRRIFAALKDRRE
ncbi:MAG: hypothetical protein HN368_19325, partial [Spirochaetales bacterium]|nr:hypothetical protein [Spirochaetales bacterium]